MGRNRTPAPKLRMRMLQMPCVICGQRGDIRVDHVIPFSKGGDTVESNLQPLCSQCNYHKSNKLSNDELRTWYEGRKEEHHLRAEWQRVNRFKHWTEVPNFSSWRHANAK